MYNPTIGTPATSSDTQQPRDATADDIPSPVSTEVQANTKQPRNPSSSRNGKDQTFRLMDLPVELRLMIAEYAATEEKGIFWKWTEQSNTRAVGTFVCRKGDTEYPPNALSRVSRQLYDEVNGMTLKCVYHTLTFDADYLNITNWRNVANPPSRYYEVRQAWKHFSRLASPEVRAKMNLVLLRYYTNVLGHN
ncbi:hypothetical protein P280DRAFT_554524 [Massarina eburnea CBS 473.64]|uniref:Uncharacterized protein n=1 Tax=Massarina eburnea CBS 473.64 TaxID=1395130 RepID=A0A6A6RGR2_9PLEO|nr:hypothetical protein P280DRAFT_554524 [Massarina eburnea CBS 473.64]